MTLHRGKIARAPTITSVRALTRDDLMMIKATRDPLAGGVGQGVVARLRDPHHRLARLIAAGLRTEEVVERSGYSNARVATIRKDPAFIELVATYRGKVDEAFVREQDEFQSLALANMRKAETMIAEKLEAAEETNEFLPTRDLIAIVGDRADRFGYGKRQTNLNVNVDFASTLEKARARSAQALAPRTIDLTPVGGGSSPMPQQSSLVPAFGPAEALPLPAPKLLRRV